MLATLFASALLLADLSKVVAPEAQVKKLAGGLGFTEGPVWIPAEAKLVFSDIPASKLLKWSAEKGVELFRVSENANGNLLDLEGRLISCQHGARNIVRTEKDGTLTVLAQRFEGKRFNSPNDVAIRSDGTLWFTDPPWGLPSSSEGKELPGHWVYRLDPKSGDVRVILRDLVMPNGIAFSPDETRLYVADTGGHPSHPDETFRGRPATVSAYKVKRKGELAKAPVWQARTRCDGMCVDERGNVYVTGQDAVTVLKPSGTELGRIPVPEQPANVCFGGEDYKTLFITARTSLYSIEMQVAGAKPPGSKW